MKFIKELPYLSTHFWTEVGKLMVLNQMNMGREYK